MKHDASLYILCLEAFSFAGGSKVQTPNLTIVLCRSPGTSGVESIQPAPKAVHSCVRSGERNAVLGEVIHVDCGGLSRKNHAPGIAHYQLRSKFVDESVECREMLVQSRYKYEDAPGGRIRTLYITTRYYITRHDVYSNIITTGHYNRNIIGMYVAHVHVLLMMPYNNAGRNMYRAL